MTSAPSEIESAVAARYSQLSPGQRRVVDRLLADVRYAAIVSAPELAQHVGVSESTITRAAQTLGFAGYPDFQARLRERFVSTIPDRVQASADELGVGTPVLTGLQVMLEDAESIRSTAEDLSPTALTQAVLTLITAESVAIFGSRGSHGLAIMLCVGLRLLLADVRLLSQAAGDLPDQLLGLQAGDAIVVIGFHRVDRVTVDVLQHAAELGASTIAITDRLANPLARAAHLVLPVRLGPLRVMPSYAAAASLINALTAAVALSTRTRAPSLELAERLWQTFGSHAEQ